MAPFPTKTPTRQIAQSEARSTRHPGHSDHKAETHPDVLRHAITGRWRSIVSAC